MILVPISEGMKKTALAYATQVHALRPDESNYTHLSVDNRYYYGFLGEQVFKRFLESNHVPHKYSTDADMLPYDAEFIIHEKTVDVKTASRGFHSHIMMPYAQSLTTRADYYVGIRLGDGIAEIFGYCKLADFEPPQDFGYGVPTLAKKLVELRPIREILGLDNGL